MKKTVRNLFYTFVMVLFAASCYPGGPETTEDMDIVGTFYDKEYNFKTPTAVNVAPEVKEIENPESDDSGEYDHDNDPLIIGRIKENLTNIGYTLTDNPTEADLWVTAAVSMTENTGYYYDWWYNWYGYYYPWYGWGGGYYPGYYPGYPTVSYYSYTTGTIFINMQDPLKINAPAENDTTSVLGVWVAAINGLANSSVSQERINSTIDRAFNQSPYLGK